MENKIYNVTNRSSSLVFYTIPDKNIHRQFNAGESKKISHEELQALAYQPGGQALIKNFLFIAEPEGVEEFNGKTEPEYYLDAKGVEDLILNKSLDEFLDCLDFAPEGVIDLIKKKAMELPISDIKKAEALKASTGFDALKALENSKEDKVAEAATKERRTGATVEKTATPGRRVYKVVSGNE